MTDEDRIPGSGTPRSSSVISSLRLAVGVGLLLLLATLAPRTVLVRAQADALPVGTVVRIANTDGEPLNLRAGPAPDHPVVARLAPDETVTVIAAPQVDGTTRWIPVRTASGLLGWISDQYVAPVIVAEPQPSPTPELAVDEPTAPMPAALASPEPMLASGQSSAGAETQPVAGRPVEVEAKLKFPEAKGRHQEVTIWVTRDGKPIEGAIVTLIIPDDEDQEVRTLEPTNVEGRTIREFALGRTKGSVNLLISAVAPDGGKGQTETSYFVR